MTNDTKQNLSIVNMLLEASETLRRLMPDTYDEKSREVQQVIRQVMEAQGKDVLPATLMLMETAQEQHNEIHILWLAAAATDMLAGQQPHKSLKTQLAEQFDFL